MSTTEWLGVGGVIATSLILDALRKVVLALKEISEHLRVIRHHELPAIQRGADAAATIAQEIRWKMDDFQP